MHRIRRPTFVSTSVALLLLAVVPVSVCSSQDDGSGAHASCCSGLDTTVRAQATLRGAINLTIALKDPIAAVAGKTIGAFKAIGDVGVSAAACMASSLQASVEAQASISVSVEASASVSAG